MCWVGMTLLILRIGHVLAEMLVITCSTLETPTVDGSINSKGV